MRGVFMAIVSFCFLLSCSVGHAAPVTSPFGWRIHPISGVERFHTGTDIGYEYGEPVAAMLPGKVAFAGVWGGYGNCVILEHGNGDHTLYGHMSEILVSEGQRVGLHETVGLIGSTGYSTGPHLHLEWWHNGQYVDPLPLYSLSPMEAYAFSPASYDAPIEAAMASATGGEVEGFGFGFDKGSDTIRALDKPKQGKAKPRRKQQTAPTDYTQEQLAQMRQAVHAEAVAEAKRQLKAEEEAKKERVFFKFGLNN